MSRNRTELLKLLASGELWDYGIDLPAAAKLTKGRPLSIVAGLNNSDSDGVLLQLLDSEDHRRKLFQGMKTAAQLLDAETQLLVLPDDAAELAGQLREEAAGYGVELVIGLLDTRRYQDCAVFHLAVMTELMDFLAGAQQTGIYLAVNDSPLIRVAPDCLISDLIGAYCLSSGQAGGDEIKGLRLGNRIYGPEAQRMTVAAAAVNNGVIKTYTSRDCMVQEAQKALRRNRERSCGTCVFCREGLIQLDEMHKDIIAGKGRPEYTGMAGEIGTAMKDSCLCSLGQEGADGMLSAISGFPDEYSAHIKRKKCPSGVCFVQAKATLYIDPAACIGCEECQDSCPAGCIEGKKGYIHMIDSEECTGCGACLNICENDAIIRTEGKMPKLPARLVKCGKFKNSRR